MGCPPSSQRSWDHSCCREEGQGSQLSISFPLSSRLTLQHMFCNNESNPFKHFSFTAAQSALSTEGAGGTLQKEGDAGGQSRWNAVRTFRGAQHPHPAGAVSRNLTDPAEPSQDRRRALQAARACWHPLSLRSLVTSPSLIPCGPPESVAFQADSCAPASHTEYPPPTARPQQQLAYPA